MNRMVWYYGGMDIQAGTAVLTSQADDTDSSIIKFTGRKGTITDSGSVG